ncbi:MAG: hypothetical protein AB7Q17_03140 [Phycisphaerae bacterium]
MGPVLHESPAPPDAVHTRARRLLLFAAGLPLVTLLALHALDVPLGCPGRMTYLYSRPPQLIGRLAALPAAAAIAGVLAVGVWLAGDAGRGRRTLGVLTASAGIAAAGAWSYFSPPAHVNQHVFNFISPSHDGAFVREALEIDDPGEYVRNFPQRARTPPAEMKGTRVISNPPATTLLIWWLREHVVTLPALKTSLDDFLSRERVELPRERTLMSVALVSAWVLQLTWLLATPLFYALARLFCDPAPALAYAICCVVSPMTLAFAPGKDAAQLLTLALPLLLFLRSLRRGSWVAGAAAGAVLIPTVLVSLVHAWLALALTAAATLATWRRRDDRNRCWFCTLLPAIGGALASAAVVEFAFGVPLLATVAAVARSQSEVTRGPDAMPLLWQLIGVPLFLLFAGPTLWAAALAAGQSRHPRADAVDRARPPADSAARFGFHLLIATSVVLISTAPFTNAETPRLWIPFAPLLLLGALLVAQANAPRWVRDARFLALLVALQVGASAAHWSLMDMREAEMRLTTGRLFR